MKPGQIATVFGTSSREDSLAEMRVTIPANNVAAVHIKWTERPEMSPALLLPSSNEDIRRKVTRTV
jgi:hypothetical protein